MAACAEPDGKSEGRIERPTEGSQSPPPSPEKPATSGGHSFIPEAADPEVGDGPRRLCQGSGRGRH